VDFLPSVLVNGSLLSFAFKSFRHDTFTGKRERASETTAVSLSEPTVII
jgi:hypothetical protein